MVDVSKAETRRTRRSLAIAGLIAAIAIAAIGFGLYRIVVWLEPPPIELPPEGMRAQPGLQQFMPRTERRLLAKQRPADDTEEPLAVAADHPFAKTRITGRVFDIDSGEGLAGAWVRIKPTFGVPRLGPPQGDGSVAYPTRADGSYAMKGVPAGTFDLDVSASGYMPAHSSFKKFSAIEDDDGFDVGMVRGGTLEGLVIDASERPVAGAQVYAGTSEAITVHKDTVLATTSADGRFMLDPVDARALHVYAAHPRFGSAMLSLAADSLDRRVRIVLKNGRAIRGHVRDSDGPVSGARVTVGLQRVDDRLVALAADSRFAGVTTDHDGAFEIAVADADTVVLMVRASGYELASQLVGDPGREVDVVLEAALEFQGRVLTAEGKPALKAEVSIAPSANRGRRAALSAWTDEQGRFRIEGVPRVGPYTVIIRHFAHPVLSLTEDDIRGERTYRLDPQSRILGTIIDASSGRPITKYQYSVSGTLRRQASAVSISGAFEIDQLPAGKYAITVEATGYEAATVESIAVDAGDTASNVLVRMKPAGSIVGRIKGSAIAGVVIVHAWEQDSRTEAEAVVSDDGGFSFKDLPSGMYTLTAFGDGDQGEVRGEVQDVRVESGGVTKNVEITLAPSGGGSDPG